MKEEEEAAEEAIGSRRSRRATVPTNRYEPGADDDQRSAARSAAAAPRASAASTASAASASAAATASSAAASSFAAYADDDTPLVEEWLDSDLVAAIDPLNDADLSSMLTVLRMPPLLPEPAEEAGENRNDTKSLKATNKYLTRFVRAMWADPELRERILRGELDISFSGEQFKASKLPRVPIEYPAFRCGVIPRAAQQRRPDGSASRGAPALAGDRAGAGARTEA